jgi:hypothetical protein
VYDSPIKAPKHNNIACPIDVDTDDSIINVSPMKFNVKGNAIDARFSKNVHIDNSGMTIASPL